MSAQRLEAALALLYTDAQAREAFCAEPRAWARGMGLDDGEVEALAAIDRDGLVMAARSYAAKREAGARSRRAGKGGWLRRVLG